VAALDREPVSRQIVLESISAKRRSRITRHRHGRGLRDKNVATVSAG
jgi:hypothetical protein